MNVLITGGSGRIGRYVVQEFASAGHSVLNADMQPLGDQSGKFLRVDLTDAGQAYQAVAKAKADAVVHLGAWPNPNIVPDTKTYGDNVRGTFNIFQACADLGVKRIISASSAQVYGFSSAPPLYAPVEEHHPTRPNNCYALSKVVGEQTADYFVNNFGLTILSFRFMGVRAPNEIAPQIEQIAADPASGSWLLWTRTDARDAAIACRLGIEAEQVEAGPYNITGAEIVLNAESAALVNTHFGDATEIRTGLNGAVSPLSTSRAHSAFGYAPRYTWNEHQQYPD